MRHLESKIRKTGRSVDCFLGGIRVRGRVSSAVTRRGTLQCIRACGLEPDALVSNLGFASSSLCDTRKVA